MLADAHAVALGRTLDAVLDRGDVFGAVLGGVVLVMNVAPRRPDMLGGVDRVLLVRGIGKRDVAVLMLAAFGVHVRSALDSLGHGVPRKDQSLAGTGVSFSERWERQTWLSQHFHRQG